MEHLGGSDALFDYLGETMPLRNVPESFKKLPFVSLVYFLGEATFIVTFYGGVIQESDSRQDLAVYKISI